MVCPLPSRGQRNFITTPKIRRDCAVRGLPSLVKGAGLRILSRRGSQVQILPHAFPARYPAARTYSWVTYDFMRSSGRGPAGRQDPFWASMVQFVRAPYEGYKADGERDARQASDNRFSYDVEFYAIPHVIYEPPPKYETYS